MANNSGKGTGFEYDVCQLFTEQNYFTKVSSYKIYNKSGYYRRRCIGN